MSRSASELLRGAIDMHLHVGPSNHRIPTLLNCLQAAQEAAAAGMRALVFKDQFIPTTDRAFLTNECVSGIRCFGGVALNLYVGGLNRWAVEACLKAGGRVVWMPVSHARHFLSKVYRDELGYAEGAKEVYPPPDQALTVLDESGGLRPEVIEVVAMVTKAGAILNTGHLSPKESLALIREAVRHGAQRIVVDHPLAKAVGATAEEQEEMVALGAYLEHTFGKTLPRMEQLDPREIARSIKQVGAQHCVMSTDTGFSPNPRPVEAMRMYIEIMRWAGVSDGEIEQMIKVNPAYLLGLDDSS